jgi:hypothetical protein
METSDYFTQQQNSMSASDMFFQYIAKNLVVDIGKEFSDVAFQNPCRACIVPRNRASIIAEAIYGTMGTFCSPARVRIKYKFSIKIWIENPVHCVVYKPVLNACFVNVAWLWIVNPERLI